MQICQIPEIWEIWRIINIPKSHSCAVITCLKIGPLGFKLVLLDQNWPCRNSSAYGNHLEWRSCRIPRLTFATRDLVAKVGVGSGYHGPGATVVSLPH
jgi:hypothetical protein